VDARQEGLPLSSSSTEPARRRRFEALYEENYSRILGYARRRTTRDEAADIVAETFLVAWRRLEDVPEERAGLLWLYGTARRVLANHERARRRRQALAVRIEAIDRAEEEFTAFAGGENVAMTAFAALPKEDRDLLGLVAWEGLEIGEMAAIYGCSRNAVRIRLHRARRRFARELSRHGLVAKRNVQAGQVREARRQRVGALIETEDAS
jgi:RNA polymerase sigma factor (sigma-70 family)